MTFSTEKTLALTFNEVEALLSAIVDCDPALHQKLEKFVENHKQVLKLIKDNEEQIIKAIQNQAHQIMIQNKAYDYKRIISTSYDNNSTKLEDNKLKTTGVVKIECYSGYIDHRIVYIGIDV